MKAAVIQGPGNIRVEHVPDPQIHEPHDAVVAVTHAAICGSDLWAYQGTAPRKPGQRMGHEFIGVVEEIGCEVTTVRPGDRVIAPFVWSDGTCAFCTEGLHTSCERGGFWGVPGADGGQGEAVRVPFADGTLIKVPSGADETLDRALLTLCDVMGTGHHAATAAGIGHGDTVVVVGDGAVGLCGVLAARRLGAERIVLLGRHPQRTALARHFGATETVPERGEEAIARLHDLIPGKGASAVIEAVGTWESLHTAISVARPGAAVGFVGAPHGVGGKVDVRQLFDKNVSLRGGMAPVRAYIPQLLPDVLDGNLDPSPVFDLSIRLAETPIGYAAMQERHAIKALIHV
ncbi:alcohol dehydrogenase catalytic domain-containing protein [Streptomyces sp. NPDC097941]|uniref:alcohol dehydrogenase catalytic domain-containing protein n=1 Tax=Streptomyces sp. NPDC097941 TaxID=3155685 RepID=UPI00331D0E8B